jgi:lipopolysaccharide export system permease protein
MFKEMLAPFILNVAFFMFVFLMATLLDITNYIVNYKASIFALALLLLYSMPFSLQFVIPMSVMIAILLTLLRMSSDNEIIALKAGGVSIYKLLPPVLLFSLMGCLITAGMTIFAIPWGRSAMKNLANNIAASSLEIGLKERTFNDSFQDVMLYVNRIDPRNKVLMDVFIEDKRNEKLVSTIVAAKGKLLSEPEQLIFRLRLFDGMINQVNIKDRNVNVISFETYDISLDMKQALENRKKESKHRLEMSLAEMRRALKTTKEKDVIYYRIFMEYHKKFSIPFACLAFGILAVPLGFQASVTRRSYGLALGLAFFILYYVLLTAGWGFGELGKYPPYVGMWAPNAVIGGLGIFLLYRAGEERPLMIEYGFRAVGWFAGRFSKKHFITKTRNPKHETRNTHHENTKKGKHEKEQAP